MLVPFVFCFSISFIFVTPHDFLHLAQYSFPFFSIELLPGLCLLAELIVRHLIQRMSVYFFGYKRDILLGLHFDVVYPVLGRNFG